MSGDPLKLVKFVCVAKAHASGRSESALTIHAGAWAFCARGADGDGHEWRPSEGLPLADALRLTPHPPPGPRQNAPDLQVKPTTTARARGKARPR